MATVTVAGINMWTSIKEYLIGNPIYALQTPPWRVPLKSWVLLPIFAVAALLLGIGGGVLKLGFAEPEWPIFFLISVLVSPALLEELIFRGLLIPRDTARRGQRRTWLVIGWSTALYVLAHPLGALTTSPGARSFFLDPVFLIIVALLGITCGYSYVISRSLWVPILIHWLTVVIWVIFLGGHELVIALEGHAWSFEGHNGSEG
jgi:predicted Abi (CAAX) family protease